MALSALGSGLEAMIGVRLRGHSREVIDNLQATTRVLPEVVAIYYLAGATDFMIHVAVRDSNHLRDFALDAITSPPDVARVETALIFDHVRSPTLPGYALSEPDPA